MFGDCHQDDTLRQAWHDFCDHLKDSGELIFRDTTPASALTRAHGLRLLARNIALGLQFELENNNPAFPELLHYFDPLRKQGGDNTDALYVGAPINGSDTFRLWGHRGSARFLAITVLEDGNTPWGGAVIGTLFDKDIVVDEQGRFEVILSPDPQPGNWIKTTPDSYRVTVRQFFADWDNETPMNALIDRLGSDTPAPLLSVEQLGKGLRAAAHWVRWSSHYWAEQLDKWQAHPNTFYAYSELDDNKIDATPGGLPLIAYWKLAPDEALIVRVTPPDAQYWAVEFGNYWWETMDYRYRLCSTNCHHAQLEDDGELIVVVSHQDPGLPNWMDPSGHGEGYITYRWVGAASYPRPSCEKIRYAELRSHLPDSVKIISAQERQKQLRERRLGVIRRFGS